MHSNPCQRSNSSFCPCSLNFASLLGISFSGHASTHVKLSPKEPEKIEYIIANCAECEPYLTADYRRMIENPEDLVAGMKIILQLFDHAKGVFGGLGQNFMNPALGGRCFLLIAFAADMTNFKSSKFEAYSGATPLAMIRNEGLSSVNVMDMLTGKIPGTIGETSVIAILIGAIILILLGVITLRIPAAYLITFAVFMLIFGKEPMNANYLVAELCGGGLMLGAFFMATDYVTSPITPAGQIIYGICCGLLTGIFRCFGANAEGVSFAIILSNILVPIIEKFTIPRAFGLAKEAKKNE
jgi:Na+-translocating ferredoxin:NAD+ oxidoreductase subunit D